MITYGENILDSRESEEMKREASSRGWDIKALTFEDHLQDKSTLDRIITITRGDADCGDAANFRAVIELKTLADAMNWKHLIYQVHKMIWTGKFVAVVIRDYFNSRLKLVSQAKMSEDRISAIEHIFQVKLVKLGVPFYYTTSINDTFNRMEYFFEHCGELEKPLNTLNDHKFKFETPIVILCGIEGIGEHHARLLLKAAGSLENLVMDIYSLELVDFITNYKQKLKGIGPRIPEMAWRGFHEKLREDESAFTRLMENATTTGPDGQ